ncbi:MAG: hypothetical protein RIT27_2069 [Pseudomonadota bacterium]|jgi:hypothetical protein
MSKKMLSFMLLLAGLLCMVQLPVQAGNDPSYQHDEAKNPDGPNRCTNSNQCDGARRCSSAGWCQGVARTPPPAKSSTYCQGKPNGSGQKGPTYCWDEAKNPDGPNRCTNSNQCDGARLCSGAGWCQGTSGH